MPIIYDPQKFIVCPFCGGRPGLTNLETGNPVACPRCGGKKVVPRIEVA